MKKLISALCVLAVSVGFAIAANATDAKQIDRSLRGDDVIGNGSNSKAYSINSFTPSAVFDYGFHGSAFGRWDSRRMSYVPETGLMSSIYDQKDPSGPKATGVIANVWGEEFAPVNANPSGDFYPLLPTTVACGDYAVGIMADPTKTDQSLFIKVYSKLDEEWTAKIPVKTATGVTPAKVRVVHGDMTKGADNNYYLMMTLIYENVAYADRKGCVIIGKTSNPFSGTWTFSDYNDMKFIVSATSTIKEVVTDFHGAWGKNGFGYATAMGQNHADSLRLYYTYTKDYGQTWQTLGNSVEAGYKELNLTKKPIEYMLPCVGDSMASTSGAIIFDNSWIRKNFSMVVDEKNDVHYVVKGDASKGTSYYPRALYTDNNVPVGGYWRFSKKFDAAGSPEPSTVNEGWDVGFIAHYAGKVDDLGVDVNGTEVNIEGQFSNVNIMSLAYAGNGCLVASWLDRPRVNPLSTEAFGEAVGVTPQDKYYTFVLNPYVIASYNYGQTWERYVAPTDSNNTLRAFEIETYTDNKVFELGFGLAKDGKSSIGADGKKTAEIYAAYAIPQLSAPSPLTVFPAGATGPGTAHHKWEQNYHFMKIQMKQEQPEAINVGVTSTEKNISLSQNYPNPFNPTTAINFTLKNAGNVNLTVYNAKGESVANLINANMTQGTHTASFNASSLNSGVYFYKLTVGGQSAVRKMVLTK